MKGYTIQHSIELLEKQAGSGSGGASTAAQVSFDNTGTGLVATNVQGALEEINGKPEHVYSSTEQEVGKWTDGSTIYETTVHLTALPAASTTGTEYPHGIANIDKIVGIQGIVTFAGGNVTTIPHVVAKGDSVASQISIVANTTNLIVAVGADRSSCTADVTLQYVKTAPVTNTRSKKAKKEE